MSEPVQIVRYHVDVESRQIVVQCRRYDEATGTYLPLPPNLIRHVMPVNQDLLDAIERDVRPFLERDLSEVSDAHPAAVTSALHHLRETRFETDRVRREHDEQVQRARKSLDQIHAEKQEAERLKAIAEVETDAILRRRGAL